MQQISLQAITEGVRRAGPLQGSGVGEQSGGVVLEHACNSYGSHSWTDCLTYQMNTKRSI